MRTLAAQDPSRWCPRSASPLWDVVQGPFKTRNVLPCVKVGLAETLAELWSVLKPTRWDSGRGQRQAVLLGRCRMKVLSHHPDMARGRLLALLGWGVRPWCCRVAGGG